MTPTEFLRSREIIAEDKTDLIIGFTNGTKESLIELLEAYHQSKLQESELLLAFSEFITKDLIDNVSPKEIVERFLSQ